jgi:hypothetical protein
VEDEVVDESQDFVWQVLWQLSDERKTEPSLATPLGNPRDLLVEGPIEFDTLSGKILNSKPASSLLHREYCKGWSL